MPTTSWTSNGSASWRTASSGGGSGGWRTDNNYVYQGEWSNFGLHRGLWFFNDSNIRSVLSGQIITNIRMRATRRSAGGVTAAQTPTIYRHNYSSQPSGTPSGSAGHSNHGQSWAWGDTKWVTLPIAYGNHLRDGSARGILIYTASGSPYMIFTGTAILEITYQPAVVPPATPGGFSIGTVTTTAAALSWNSVSNADHYRYTNQQLNPTGSTNEFTTTGTSVNNSSGIASNRRYRWRVRAENSAGNSSYTSYITRTTMPTTPTGVSASTPGGVSGQTSITISWNAIAGTETDRYRVDRSGGGTLTTTGTSLTWTGLSPDTTYSFRVRSENPAGNASYSGWVSSKTNLPAPGVPSQPSASNLTETSVRITWGAVSYAANYDVRRNGVVIISNTTSRDHTISNLDDNTTYNFDVRAKNATGNSAYSTQRTITTPPIHVAPPVPTALGPSGFVGPGVIELTAHTAEMDQEKNFALDQRIRWQVSPTETFETIHGGLQSAYGGPGTKTLNFDLEGTGLVPGEYWIRARTEHNGNFDNNSAWTDPVNITYTRVRVWDGNAWVPKRVFTYDGSDWVEHFPRVRKSSAWL